MKNRFTLAHFKTLKKPNWRSNVIKAHETTGLWFCVMRDKFSIWLQEVSEGTMRRPAFTQLCLQTTRTLKLNSDIWLRAESPCGHLGGQRGQCIPVSIVVAEGTWPGTIMSSGSWELIWPPPLFAFLNLSAVLCNPFPPMRTALCRGNISLPQISYHRTISSLNYFHYNNLS